MKAISKVGKQSTILTVLSGLMFVFAAQEANATVTYIVGTCKKGTQFSTISAALAASPAPNVVEVCGATYAEQVEITKPVSLEGILDGTNDAPLIGVPSGGLKVNATDDLGNSIAAQIWVHDVTGVNISNLLIGGKNNGITGPANVVGIFYQNAGGTVNHVVTRNQANAGNGIGIQLEGGGSNPTVTVENSSIHGFDYEGILTETNSSASQLTAKITGNSLLADLGGVPLILYSGTTVTVTLNNINGFESFEDIVLFGAEGSISGNTVQQGVSGILVFADAAIAAKSNKILNTLTSGVYLNTSIKSTQIQANTIENSPVGIEFGCSATNGQVHSNTIVDTGIGLSDVPSGTTSVNTFYVVGAETGGSCP